MRHTVAWSGGGGGNAICRAWALVSSVQSVVFAMSLRKVTAMGNERVCHGFKILIILDDNICNLGTYL